MISVLIRVLVYILTILADVSSIFFSPFTHRRQANVLNHAITVTYRILPSSLFTDQLDSLRSLTRFSGRRPSPCDSRCTQTCANEEGEQ